MNNQFHILSLNCQGLRHGQKLERLNQYILIQKANIVFIQESHFTPEMSTILHDKFCEWDLYNAYGNNVSRGCSIFIRKDFASEVIDFDLDKSGRFVLLNIIVDNNTYTFVNVYANNEHRNRNNFFNALLTVIESKSQGILIIGGDMNDTLGIKDRLNKNNTITTNKNVKPKTVKNLLKLIKEHNLCDIWRENNEIKAQYTWRRKNSTEKSRIDMWLIDSNIIPLVYSTDIRPACIKYTDHLAISLKILIPNNRGPGYYKINNSYLDDKDYSNFISNALDSVLVKHKHSTIQVLWEMAKTEIKEKSIIYAKKRSKDRQCQIKHLESKLKLMLENDDENDNIENIQQELAELYEIKAKGAQIRSKVEYIEKGEKNTKYFLGLEKSRQTRKLLTKVNINGNMYTNTESILSHVVNFYSNLYTPENISASEINNYLSQTPYEQKLTESEANLCEGLFTVTECELAVMNMKLNKSPGLDGISIEFYKHFWDKIGVILTEVLNDGFLRNELTFSQRTGALSLLYKKGDPTNLENWRPISLLNTDYKIAARVLADRLKKVIHKIINLDQQGYIKNRYIGYNLRQIQDIIDYAEDLQIDGAILFVDFRKAFDTVEHEFLFKTLKHFGFKNGFIKWIKTLYSNCQTYVLNNGWISKPFKPKRGVRQGCPISSLLFIIVAEIMALNIRNSNLITGIDVKSDDGNKSLKISQLADDTTLFLKAEPDILQALQTIEHFGDFSGLRLNKNKTEAMWIGRNKLNVQEVGNIKWPSKPIKALGIHFGHNKRECEQLNWQTKIDNCKKVLNNWSKRRLTIYGKIKIIKTLVIPKFTYAIHSLVVPKYVVQEINKLIYCFLWDNKREKIKRSTLIGNKHEGGIEMIDIASYIISMKIKWVKALTDNTKANWKVIPEYFYRKFGPNFLIFYMNSDNMKSLNVSHLPDFYKNILELWIQTKNITTFKKPDTFVEIRNELLWGNRNIKHNGKFLIFNNWINSNILFINDIIDDNGVLSERSVYNKLKVKTNWIAELNLLKLTIPKKWITLIKNETSRLTTVKTRLELKINNKRIQDLVNKQVYQFLLKGKFTKPYIHRYWNHYFHKNTDWLLFYRFINNLYSNKIKQYKYKSLHRIFPCKEIRYKWKMVENPNCNICNIKETYEHVFLECPVVSEIWDILSQYLREIGIIKNLKSLRTIIIGYKIAYPGYFYLNTILAVFGFCIYKAYFISESRSKPFNIFNLFKTEILILLKYLENNNDNNIFIIKLKSFLNKYT